jgi:large subunit ribosomal protein L4
VELTVPKLKKYSLAGKEVGHVDIDDNFVQFEANSQMIKDYIVAIRANARQWSANTKTRAEVKHTTRKPHPQKGTGRARQGMLVAPQYRGGGRVFGPRPKFDQHVRINKKERQAAIRYMLAEKIKAEKVLFLDKTELKEPKTKKIAKFLKTLNLSGCILFLGEAHYAEVEKKTKVSVRGDKHQNFIKSIQNIPSAEFVLASNVNGYDLMHAQSIIMTEEAFNEFSQRLGV